MTFPARDKVLHFLAGLVISFLVSLSFVMTVGWGVLMGIPLAAAAGIAKEGLKDSGYLLRLWPTGPGWLVDPGEVDIMDLAATIVGGTVGPVFVMLVV